MSEQELVGQEFILAEQELSRVSEELQDVRAEHERILDVLRRIRDAYLSLKCPGCKNTFTSKGNHCPKVLGCRHSLCKACVSMYTVKCTCFCPVDNEETLVERKLATCKLLESLLEKMELIFLDALSQ
uniref:RING-type domain-containing protein n=1 Tax=Biomphalaria glabrata TaxID=6526 RepID=A0A2C9KVS0_BIOGL